MQQERPITTTVAANQTVETMSLLQICWWGLIKVMNEALSDGESVHLGEFGSFRMVAGSKGSATVDGFTTALFNRAHIVFYPGTMLINLVNNVSFERYVPKKDASSESAGSGGGTDDRPGEL